MSTRRVVSSVLARSTPSLRRTVVHHARPPRVPVLPSPHHPRAPLPTSGTAHLIPSSTSSSSSTPSSSSSQPTSLTRSVRLEGTRLTLHHSPPPSEPTYTTGAVPDLLRWVGGQSVQLSGQERAPVVRPRCNVPVGEGSVLEWGKEMLEKIKQLRAEGLSRKQIADSLSIPQSQQHLIARIAPLSTEQAHARTKAIETQRDSWGPRKRLSRDIRQLRKDFW